MARLIRYVARTLTAPDGSHHRVVVPLYGPATPEDISAALKDLPPGRRSPTVGNPMQPRPQMRHRSDER